MQIRSFFVIGVVCSSFLVFACQSSSDSGTAAGFGDQEVLLTKAHPEATTTKAWLTPKTLLIGAASTRPEEGEMVIDGLLVGWRFFPLSNVIGQLQEPPVKARCRQVWVVLEDRSIHRRKDGDTPPDRTYLPGLFDPETSLFYPESAQIVRVEVPPASEPG